MQWLSVLATGAVLLMVAPVASAQIIHAPTGMELLRQCDSRASDQSVKGLETLLCLTYLDGFIQGHRVTTDLLMPPKPLLCMPPDGIEVEQAQLVVVKWLKDHPESLHASARISVMVALSRAFPCD